MTERSRAVEGQCSKMVARQLFGSLTCDLGVRMTASCHKRPRWTPHIRPPVDFTTGHHERRQLWRGAA